MALGYWQSRIHPDAQGISLKDWEREEMRKAWDAMLDRQSREREAAANQPKINKKSGVSPAAGRGSNAALWR